MSNRGNSFANGNSESGPAGYRTWLSGWQAPRPVTSWEFTEPSPEPAP
jgi:hypothetical protein